MPSTWMVFCGISVIVAVISEFANRRRTNRKDINKVGFMPWPFITAISLLISGISIAFGLGLIDTS